MGTDAVEKKGGGNLDLWVGKGAGWQDASGNGAAALPRFFRGEELPRGLPRGFRLRSAFDPRPDPSNFDPVSI